MKNKYVIIDMNNYPVTISGSFDNLDEAKQRCYAWRKKRYANGNLAKELEYDSIKPDMGFNVIKISENLF